MPRFVILRSTSGSSARLSSTWKHTYSSFSCLRTLRRSRFSSIGSVAVPSRSALACSSSRTRERFASRSTTSSTFAPTRACESSW